MYIFGTLQAIAYFHEKNVIHRDVKLENILTSQTSDGEPVAILTDYGLAKKSTGEKFSERCGSIGYVAPEVYQGSYTLNADIYSLG
jgi:serine/threonine protein kinase